VLEELSPKNDTPKKNTKFQTRKIKEKISHRWKVATSNFRINSISHPGGAKKQLRQKSSKTSAMFCRKNPSLFF